MDLGRRRIVCVGEAMIELAPHHGGWDVGYGGDTLNLALHLTRLGHDVAFFSALGSDPFAGRMKSEWGREGLDCSLLLTDEKRNTGLYAIEIDPKGERRFHYWRGQSAAKVMFESPGTQAAQAEAMDADLLVFSLISLAILPVSGRERLLRLGEEVRANGGKVGFDGNFRMRLWESRDEARDWHDMAVAIADFGLPTLSDEIELHGPTDENAVAARWSELGCDEVLVKMGERGCRLPDGRVLPPPAILDPVDTSGAGDAFDAGYLAARMRGRTPEDASHLGQRLAAWTVMRKGAIPPRDHAAPYGEMLSA